MIFFAPGRTLLFSTVTLIAIGSILLALPSSRTCPMQWLDIIFSATSSVCVTGMFTVPLNNFSFIGQLFLLLLLQVGGISLITFTSIIASRVREFGLADHLKARQFSEIEIGKNGTSLIPFIISCTLIFEIIGALIMFPTLYNDYPWHRALFLSFFQSISAFCNIGVSLFGYDIEQHSHVLSILWVTTSLMFLGSIGFPTLKELMDCIVHKISPKDKKIYSLSLQSKIILWGSSSMTIIGMVLYCFAEYNNTLAELPFLQQISTMLFHAVSFRSAGFLLVPISTISLTTVLIIMLFGFVGSSPGSTGSGVKITSFAIFIASLRSIISGNTQVNIGGRRIATDQVLKSFAIIALSATWILGATFILTLTESNHSLLEILLEACSAFTNQGISSGLTEHLSRFGKLVIIGSMIVGRVGSMAFILALAKKSLVKSRTLYSYPEERIMLE